MKNMVLSLIVISLLLAGSCEKKQPPANYQIQHITEPLSASDTETALEVLGLKIERFNYYLPVKTQVTFFGQEYINGTAQNITSNSSLYLDPGMQKLTLFIHNENGSVKFYTQAERVGRVGCGTLDIAGYGGSTSGWLKPKEIKSGTEVPLYLFATNKKGIESFSPEEKIEDIVKKYELVYVIYADID